MMYAFFAVASRYLELKGTLQTLRYHENLEKSLECAVWNLGHHGDERGNGEGRHLVETEQPAHHDDVDLAEDDQGTGAEEHRGAIGADLAKEWPVAQPAPAEVEAVGEALGQQQDQDEAIQGNEGRQERRFSHPT